MLRVAMMQGRFLMGLFPFSVTDERDKVADSKEKDITLSPGMDRLRDMYTIRKENEYSNELQSILNITVASGFIGAIVNGIRVLPYTAKNYVETHQVTLYYNKTDAMKRLGDAVFLQFAKGAATGALKFSLFSTVYSGTVVHLTVYKGKHEISNYAIGGSLTGLLFRMHMGLKGAIAGTVIGGILGTFSGAILVFLSYISGISIDEVYATQNRWATSRRVTTGKTSEEQLVAEKMYKENLKLREILAGESREEEKKVDQQV